MAYYGWFWVFFLVCSTQGTKLDLLYGENVSPRIQERVKDLLLSKDHYGIEKIKLVKKKKKRKKRSKMKKKNENLGSLFKSLDL